MLEEELEGAEREISMMADIQYDMTQDGRGTESGWKQSKIHFKFQNYFSEDLGQEIQ